MKAVIMAGGVGSRLRPMTLHTPKPLVPVCNTPIIEHVLRLLQSHNIDEVIITLHYQADMIQSYLGNGSAYGMKKIHYVVEDRPLGTAGSVKNAAQLIDNETFLIISGDALTDCDLTGAIQFHKSIGSLATLVLNESMSSPDFGIVKTASDGRITGFVEKPTSIADSQGAANTGIYIMEHELLNMMEKGPPYDWSSDIFPLLLHEGWSFYGYISQAHWRDVGTFQRYKEAQVDMMQKIVNLPLRDFETQPGIYIGTNTEINDSAQLIAPVCIGCDVQIDAETVIGPNTVIGDYTVVKAEAEIKDSVLWDYIQIGPHAKLDSSIVCSCATIDADTILPKDNVIGDHCHISTKNNLKTGEMVSISQDDPITSAFTS